MSLSNFICSTSAGQTLWGEAKLRPIILCAEKKTHFKFHTGTQNFTGEQSSPEAFAPKTWDTTLKISRHSVRESECLEIQCVFVQWSAELRKVKGKKESCHNVPNGSKETSNNNSDKRQTAENCLNFIQSRKISTEISF